MSKKLLVTKPLKFIDLFSGCGGFSTGLEMAGHQCLLGVDYQKDAIDSFALNHYYANTYHGDIRKLTSKRIDQLVGDHQIDMVVGGPPCQGFSTVGKGLVEDERNQLFKEFVRVVKHLKPKIVLFENVTGMLAQKNRPVLLNIFKNFERLGYTMDAKVLSSEEFGVPSKRRRAIIMGVLGGECVFPKPTHGQGKGSELITVKEAFSHLTSLDGEIYNHEIEKAKISKKEDVQRLKHIPAGAGIRYQRDEKSYLPKKLWYGVDWETLKEKRFRQTKLQRLSWDRPSPTILTSRTSYYHPSEPRYLTVREAASCQSFPNEFEFKGSITSAFRQIGNAVPPVMAMAIGEALFEIQKKSIPKSKKAELTEKKFSMAFRYQEKKTLNKASA